ncbi:NXPE family member 4-like isoform X2 [Elgaria multicarinata webbii]|uniref:NXPE family member 4-like isoform X2 n=1 Tax=Elgaria multicarinata webbii TaxID=159646 RepID=UPI002FCCC71F
MSLARTVRRAAFVALVLGIITFISYVFHKSKFTIFRGRMKPFEGNQIAANFDGSAVIPLAKKEKEVEDILRKLDQLMPSVTLILINTTTSSKNSKATILSHKDSYCVGEHLMVRLDLYDHLGKRKEYGGDFLRARIHSSSQKAGASGLIKDYRNGTFLVNFTLFWEGDVSISLLLVHPSEGVSALWAARKKGYDKILFTGKFLNGTSDVLTVCGLYMATKAELCEYLVEPDQEAFYCVKPKNVSCKAFLSLRSYNTPVSYLTDLELSLLKRSSIGVEIPQTFGDIHVVPCETLKNLYILGTNKVVTLIAEDAARNIHIQWKKHGHPFISSHEYTVKFHTSVALQIDNVAGGKDTAVVISLGQHFRPFPIKLFIQRAINIRKAIQRLLLRSPDTRVIIKGENTREMDIDQERFSDFHGYAQYLALKDIFWDLDVGFIDAWDMTIAYATNNVHPPRHVVMNQINMLLSYLC